MKKRNQNKNKQKCQRKKKSAFDDILNNKNQRIKYKKELKNKKQKNNIC